MTKRSVFKWKRHNNGFSDYYILGGRNMIEADVAINTTSLTVYRKIRGAHWMDSYWTSICTSSNKHDAFDTAEKLYLEAQNSA